MKTFYLPKLADSEIARLCERSAIDSSRTVLAAQSIIDEVKAGGDRALISLAKKYDKAVINSLSVKENKIKNAKNSISIELKNAFKQAFSNIEKFHKAGMQQKIVVETIPGVTCSVESRPIENVGLYIPGGTASLPSTVLMLSIPARLAGCKDIVLCTPPDKDGSISDSLLYAADLCGVSKIYMAGGAQAIAAMAYGTETIPKVSKIFGPGNQYVTAAKQLVSIDPAGAAIDMPAGPTEVLVVADENSRADFVASDLLAQAEHGSDSMTILVSTDEKKAEEVLVQVKVQLDTLPRKSIAKSALNNSFVLVVDNMNQAISFANRFAPEHLILGFGTADKWMDKVVNAGSVFVGPYSSESAGDYASGTNHSLPTYGYARNYSGVSVASFEKRITFQKVSQDGAKNIAPAVIAMAGAESLEAHRRAMEIRL